MKLYKGYEMVIGIEIHVELATATKIFCSCPTMFGAEPNTQCCPVCLGMPGTLPVLNKTALEYAVRAGLAMNCAIAKYSKFDRKNYFYPDLPKAYQISQYDEPVCGRGHIDITTESGESKTVGVTRIHLEEDAGKLKHTGDYTLLDCNRCGVPLIEIVSEPDMRSAEEVKAYIRAVRAMCTYTGISDAKMNEGSLRADVNLSVRRPGEPFGTRAEIKNINSINYAARAVEYEYRRQVDEIEGGGKIAQETRRFNASTGKTESMRSKENADDYRYFPEPDLPPVVLDDEYIDRVRESIPELPQSRIDRYVRDFGITAYDGALLTVTRTAADYFETVAALTKYPKLAANLIIGGILAGMSADGDGSITVAPEQTAEAADLSGDELINGSSAKRLIKMMAEGDSRPPREIAEREGLWQLNDAAAICRMAKQAVAEAEKLVADYKKGRLGAKKAIIGLTMAKSNGRANPRLVEEAVAALLD